MTSYNDVSPSFWGYYTFGGYKTTYNDNATWQTIFELTDHTGLVFSMIGPTHHNSSGTGEMAMRITVDGVVYTIAPSISTTRRTNRLVIGPVFSELPITFGEGTERPLSIGSYDDKGFARFLGQVYPWDWHAAGSQLADPFRAYMAGHPYLVFEKSLKYEVYLDTVQATTYYENTGINLNYVNN